MPMQVFDPNLKLFAFGPFRFQNNQYSRGRQVSLTWSLCRPYRFAMGVSWYTDKKPNTPPYIHGRTENNKLLREHVVSVGWGFFSAYVMYREL